MAHLCFKDEIVKLKMGVDWKCMLDREREQQIERLGDKNKFGVYG